MAVPLAATGSAGVARLSLAAFKLLAFREKHPILFLRSHALPPTHRNVGIEAGGCRVGGVGHRAGIHCYPAEVARGAFRKFSVRVA
jgi:hypothetical protein